MKNETKITDPQTHEELMQWLEQQKAEWESQLPRLRRKIIITLSVLVIVSIAFGYWIHSVFNHFNS